MRRYTGMNTLAIYTVILVLVLPALLFAKEIRFIAHVNEAYQLEADDGNIYEVAENDVGDDLINNHMGAKVMVFGTVNASDDSGLIVFVQNFNVLEEVDTATEGDSNSDEDEGQDTGVTESK